ncbi:MAG: calcium-binding protein, partial [Pseudomonadota bacterium]
LIDVENIVGSDFADLLIGNTDANVLNGGGGSDTIAGLVGADTLIGGDDIATRDLVDYILSDAGVAINLSDGTGSGGHAEGDVLTGFEDVRGSNLDDTILGDSGDNVISGAGGNDSLTGEVGDDTLAGGAGDDTLQGGQGADRLDGSSGIDVADYQTAGAGIDIDLQAGTAVGSDADGDTLTSIEGAYGSDHADTIVGSDVNNLLRGFGGADTIVGAAGADTINGGDGVDTASYATSSLGVVVDLSTGQGFNGDAQGDQIAEIENVIGSGAADSLTGDGSDNRLDGLMGDDTLTGGA